jgi:hypothetical protein
LSSGSVSLTSGDPVPAAVSARVTTLAASASQPSSGAPEPPSSARDRRSKGSILASRVVQAFSQETGSGPLKVTVNQEDPPSSRAGHVLTSMLWWCLSKVHWWGARVVP